MSDAPATNGLTTDAVPSGLIESSPQPAGTTPAPGAPSAPGATDVLAEPPAERAVFDRGYVESIRREAQRYRGEAQTAQQNLQGYDDVFGQYEQADRDVWFNLARTWATDPNRAAEVMQQIASSVLGDAGAGTAGATSPGDQPYAEQVAAALDASEPVSEARIQELIDQRFTAQQAQAAEATAIDEIHAEMRAGGFDPNTAEGFMVLWNANHMTNGDITKAMEITRGYRQQIVDEYVQGRSSGRVPLPGSANGSPATGSAEPITNLEDAKRAADAFVRERMNAR